MRNVQAAPPNWTTLTGDPGGYSVKTFDVLGRVVTESTPVAVTVNPVTGTWNTDGSAYVTTSAYDALGLVVARTAPASSPSAPPSASAPPGTSSPVRPRSRHHRAGDQTGRR